MDAIVRERPTKSIIDPQGDIIDFSPPSFNIDQLNEVENKALNEAYAHLTPEQLIAARLESSGITDRTIISRQAGGVTIDTISNWRNNPYYKMVVRVNTLILEKVNRNFREKCVKQILTPVYSEFIKRVNDPTTLELLPIKELRDIITAMHKELRLEQLIPIKDETNDGNDDLKSLQLRRNKAVQADHFEELVTEAVIQLPLL